MRDTVLVILLIGVLGAMAFVSYWYFGNPAELPPSTYPATIIDPATMGRYRQLTGVQFNVGFFSEPPFNILEENTDAQATSSIPIGRSNPFGPF